MPDTAVDNPTLADKFAAYAEAHIPGAGNLRVTHMNRIHGGASRETYSVDIAYEDATGPKVKGLILRRDPADSLIDTDRRVEFAAIRTAYGKANIPAPEALFLETDPGPLGAPFFVMGRIEGGTPLNPFRIEEVEPYRTEVGRDFFRHLGAIASLDIDGAPIADEIDTPEAGQCWKRELDHWASEIRTHAREPQPVAEAAIRYLAASPPPPAQKLALVHGDFRSGNFLHDGAGHICAVLDWEMAHIGDPYEDLAWATDLLWCASDQARAAGFIPWPEALAIWQEASGCTFDPQAFEWWSLFAHLKGLGIWISSARAFADGKNDDPILAWSGWFTHAAHELMLASRLAEKHGVKI
ncbi:phosphotransferase family protein [Henriciella aquimarina]|uniref:phosphotransferase family protein n=1 Tax=Henriciella aquimarina TaxID=545261 RepID=UPI001F1769F2|nr:phosphotransferase family protein [Henriciella aquimarina]